MDVGWQRSLDRARSFADLGGTRLDLGGIAKGYALDRAADVLRARGIASATLDAGCQRLLLGDAPADVWVAHPLERDRAAVRLALAAGSLSTSAQSEHTLRAGGRPIGHVRTRARASRSAPRPACSRPSATRADACPRPARRGPRPRPRVRRGLGLGVLWLEPDGDRVADVEPLRFQVHLRQPETLTLTPCRKELLPAMRLSRLVAPLAAVLLLSGPMLGMGTPARAADTTTDQRLSDVEKKLDAALAEIERMKLGAAAPETTAARVSRHGMGPGASRVYDTKSGPSLGGYGEMLLSSPDGERQDGQPSGQRPTADLLRAVFYVGHRFTSSCCSLRGGMGHAGVVDGPAAWIQPRARAGHALGQTSVGSRTSTGRRARNSASAPARPLVPVGLINELHEPPVFLSAPARRGAVRDPVGGIGAGTTDDAGLSGAYMMEASMRWLQAFQPIARAGRAAPDVFTHPAHHRPPGLEGHAGTDGPPLGFHR